MTIRELITKIGFKVDEKSYKDAQNKTSLLSSGAKKALASTAAVLATAFSVKKIANSVMKIAAIGDEASETSRKIGISAEALQELRFVADRQGVSSEQLSTAMDQLQKRIGEAKMGSGELLKYLDNLGDAGFKDSVLNAKNMDESFTVLADRMSKITDPTERAAFAAIAFGRGGLDMVKMTELGADGLAKMREEARALGGVVSNEFAANAEAFMDRVTDMKFALQGLGIQLANALMPLFDDMVKLLNELIQGPLGKFIKVLIDGLMPIFQMLANVISPIIQALLPVLEGLIAVLIPIVKMIGSILIPLIEFLTPILATVGELLKMIGDVLMSLTPIFDAIGVIIKALTPILNQLLKNFIIMLKPLIHIFTVLLDTILKPLLPIIELLVKLMEPYLWYLEALAPILTTLAEALEWLLKVVQKIVSFVVGPAVDIESMAKAAGISVEEAKKIAGISEENGAVPGQAASDVLQNSTINNQQRQSTVMMNNKFNINAPGNNAGGIKNEVEKAARGVFTLELQKVLINAGFKGT